MNQIVERKVLLDDKEKFIKEAKSIIFPGQLESFIDFIDDLYSSKDDIILLFNAMVVKASICCMKKLSSNHQVEDAYQLIDIQNSSCDPTYYNQRLSGYQNYLVTQIVSIYHPDGEKFTNYRSSLIKKQANKVL